MGYCCCPRRYFRDESALCGLPDSWSAAAGVRQAGSRKCNCASTHRTYTAGRGEWGVQRNYTTFALDSKSLSCYHITYVCVLLYSVQYSVQVFYGCCCTLLLIFYIRTACEISAPCFHECMYGCMSALRCGCHVGWLVYRSTSSDLLLLLLLCMDFDRHPRNEIKLRAFFLFFMVTHNQDEN